MSWDSTVSHSRMRVSRDGFTVTSDNPTYFSSARSNYAMMPGNMYYFEVELNLPNGVEVKLGVSQEQNLENENGFSGTKRGWSFYAGQGGQKRHNANSGSFPYGKLLGTQATIGVLVDMKACRLGFVIDGTWCGFAFTQPEFVCQEPLYAAFSILNARNTCTFLKKQSSWEQVLGLLYSRRYARVLMRLPEGLFRDVGDYCMVRGAMLSTNMMLDLLRDS